MSKIILVHGIGNEREGQDIIGGNLVRPLRDGIRLAIRVVAMNEINNLTFFS